MDIQASLNKHTCLYYLSYWCKWSFDLLRSPHGWPLVFHKSALSESFLWLLKPHLTWVRACGIRGITKPSVTGKCHLNPSQKLSCKLRQTMKPGESIRGQGLNSQRALHVMSPWRQQFARVCGSLLLNPVWPDHFQVCLTHEGGRVRKVRGGQTVRPTVRK